MDGQKEPMHLVKSFERADEFLKEAKEFLYSNEAEYGMLLGLSEIHVTLDLKGIQYFVISENKKILGCALLNSFNLILTNLSDTAVLELIKKLKVTSKVVPRVVGPVGPSLQFAKLWSLESGAGYELAMAQKIYKLEKVQAPETKGYFKLATEQDLDLVSQWTNDFMQEALPKEVVDQTKNKEATLKRIQKNMQYLWVSESNLPVSMCCAIRPTGNGTAISLVYTPKNLRKRGFGAAVTAHASQYILDQGKKFCVLYTDTTNPTSNKIYRSIGYNEVADSRQYLFKYNGVNDDNKSG